MIVDSNVLIDVFAPDSPTAEAVAKGFASAASSATKLCINHVIFAEISPTFQSAQSVTAMVERLGIELVGLSSSDAFRAGICFREYRRNGGPRTAILPDFLIGAQAETRGWPILTRDPKRFASYFPEVELLDPLALDND
jgi:predicted nucleic acid-binding protein